MKKPKLKEGEVYVGAIIGADEHGHHVILLPEHPKERMAWKKAMNWAKTIGGDLPDRVEQALLHAQKKAEFSGNWYWTNEEHAVHADCAWCQHFGYGYQDYDPKSMSPRVRAVRRVPFILGE